MGKHKMTKCEYAIFSSVWLTTAQRRAAWANSGQPEGQFRLEACRPWEACQPASQRHRTHTVVTYSLQTMPGWLSDSLQTSAIVSSAKWAAPTVSRMSRVLSPYTTLSFLLYLSAVFQLSLSEVTTFSPWLWRVWKWVGLSGFIIFFLKIQLPLNWIWIYC